MPWLVHGTSLHPDRVIDDQWPAKDVSSSTKDVVNNSPHPQANSSPARQHSMFERYVRDTTFLHPLSFRAHTLALDATEPVPYEPDTDGENIPIAAELFAAPPYPAAAAPPEGTTEVVDQPSEQQFLLWLDSRSSEAPPYTPEMVRVGEGLETQEGDPPDPGIVRGVHCFPKVPQAAVPFSAVAEAVHPPPADEGASAQLTLDWMKHALVPMGSDTCWSTEVTVGRTAEPVGQDPALQVMSAVKIGIRSQPPVVAHTIPPPPAASFTGCAISNDSGVNIGDPNLFRAGVLHSPPTLDPSTDGRIDVNAMAAWIAAMNEY